jgi:hypothetical protein
MGLIPAFIYNSGLWGWGGHQSTIQIFQATAQSKHVTYGQALSGPDILWKSL